ncbi:MAG TPA: thioredoxin domain-containing protein [Pirellulales bacterium]|nr:thioredoxin domain-containing protein [Pirellulales bacterium]
MSNRLAHETSPYLLQHRDNPVDWYPWGAEALDKSKHEHKPIFLSIGYSACHWCHVMEHESFENDQIAELLNENFVAIKVDREERPDLDQIYMNAVQVMTGHGGWPMSVFLTPQLEPFYGGTYWPAQGRGGMPGFDQVLTGVLDAWQNRQEQAVEQANKLTEYLRQAGQSPATDHPLNLAVLQHAEAAVERTFDFTYGGFGGAPKFPHPMILRLLLKMWRRTGRTALLELVELNLEKMSHGGIYDQLGGGFHRYSVDQEWLVPHFEKMLYDNALLSATYLDAFRATGNSDYGRVVRETLDYVLREMQHADGGFFSTQDADSEGVEGKFFVWTADEVRAVLGEEASAVFCRVYDVTDGGNFEGKNILNLPKSISICAKLMDRDETSLRADLEDAKRKLFAVRRQRIAPGLDDKVLVCWNGLMIDAMARAGGVLGDSRYRDAAAQAGNFIWQNMRRDDGRLFHTWRNGRATLAAYLDDYASLLNAYVSLYEATFDEHYVDHALELSDVLQKHFLDRERGGFFFTADDHEQLITRQKDLTDNAVPGGNGLAATGLLRLGKLTGRGELIDMAVGTLHAAAGPMHEYAMATGQLLLALEFHLGPTYELVLAGDSRDQEASSFISDARGQYLPNHVLAFRQSGSDVYRSPVMDEILESKTAMADGTTLYICENYTCREPAVGIEAARQALEQLAQPASESRVLPA